MTNEDEARLNKLFAIVAGHGTLREAREAAGLTLGQASRVLGWPRERIAALEDGAEPTDTERSILLDAYDVEGWVKP